MTSSPEHPAAPPKPEAKKPAKKRRIVYVVSFFTPGQSSFESDEEDTQVFGKKKRAYREVRSWLRLSTKTEDMTLLSDETKAEIRTLVAKRTVSATQQAMTVYLEAVNEGVGNVGDDENRKHKMDVMTCLVQ